MKIYDEVLDAILENIKIEYAGTHNSDVNSPLWGRAAYWRLYHLDGTYITKVTAPVKSIRPSSATLSKLLKAEVRKRIEAIQERCEADDYGQVHVYMNDPYIIRSILSVVEGEFLHILRKKKAGGA